MPVSLKALKRAILCLLVLPLAHAAAQPEQTADVRVLRLQIVEADTGALVAFVQEGEVLDLSDFRDDALTLVALTDPENLGAVRFYLDGSRIHQAADPPYAITPVGEDGELRAWDPPEDEHTLTVVPIATELGPDASLSAAMDRGEVGPWYEIELRGAEATEAERDEEAPADAEGPEDAETSEGPENAETSEDPGDAGDSADTESTSETEDTGTPEAPDDPEDSEDVDGPMDPESPESSEDSTAPVRPDTPEAVEPETTGDGVRAPTVPPPPLEDPEEPPQPASAAAPADGEEPSDAASAATEGMRSATSSAGAPPVEETLRLRWPLERVGDGAPVRGDVLLSHYPSDVVILAVNLAGFEDPSDYHLSLKRNGCEVAGEHLVELSPIDTRIGASLTEIAASFSALRYGNFGVVVRPNEHEEPLACAVLAVDDHDVQ